MSIEHTRLLVRLMLLLSLGWVLSCRGASRGAGNDGDVSTSWRWDRVREAAGAGDGGAGDGGSTGGLEVRDSANPRDQVLHVDMPRGVNWEDLATEPAGDAAAPARDVRDVNCIPSCKAKECGDDGCGGLCGHCAAPWHTCQDGLCRESASIGVCGGGGKTVSADCGDLDTRGCCAGQQFYYCTSFCPDALKNCVCRVDCAEDGARYNPPLEHTCTWGSKDVNAFICDWVFPALPSPDGRLLCPWYQCKADCATKQCGDDGCGGSCGLCASNQVCGFGGKCISGSAGGPGSCMGACGGRSIDSACSCNENCFFLGECCPDICKFCPGECK